ncbi:uncharacterized protein LOC116293350 [Actinia tenebrosa]|uniref:Uncharacterized protein LOC116293350 n=1 Tax=Actinia tenebrosa TaxID=6105 RepID=A0A6P8HJS2_ACTTE|nr:uncharacterized protein LOC116293350 [Actinia tenebrosa]
MPSYGETKSVKQPDDTQGIAKVELKNGSEELIAELVGCAIHLSMKDKSLRNVLQLDNKSYKEVKYFIFVPWFCSCRPKQMDEKSTKIVVKLHRYGKEQGKEFSVDENNSGGIFKKYHSNNYFVIPLPEKSSQESSFLKKWSSDLLLFNNSSQILQSKGFFYGIKKVETKNLLKFCGFKEESAKLDEQGVLLIRSSIYESYVIGCYKKENGRIKKYCFFLKATASRLAVLTKRHVGSGYEIDIFQEGQDSLTSAYTLFLRSRAMLVFFFPRHNQRRKNTYSNG